VRGRGEEERERKREIEDEGEMERESSGARGEKGRDTWRRSVRGWRTTPMKM
jgi:hypothetical protein